MVNARGFDNLTRLATTHSYASTIAQVEVLLSKDFVLITDQLYGHAINC